MENKLIIKRINELNNRTRDYKIYINGELFNNISLFEDEKVFLFYKNEIELQLKIDWCNSKKAKINFKDKNCTKILVYSSIPNKLWYFIIFGLIFSILVFLLLKINLFGVLAILFTLIPVYKITFDKNNYLRFRFLL